ncbi:MAG: hypothetical protein ACI8TP_001862 [Acidimicrobiales bacterium]|jgi:hypothetical protein
MEYLIINHSVEVEGPAPGTPEFGEMMGHWLAYNQMLIDNGHWIGGTPPPGYARRLSPNPVGSCRSVR